MPKQRVVVVGGGLSGLSAAHTALEAGFDVTMIEMNAFMGGNSTKATSGMNGAGTRTQKQMGVPDSKELFEEDTVRSATGKKTGPKPEPFALATVLTHTSADCVHWIQDRFGLALDTVSRLGGHSQPRTHRSKSGGKFPGMEITYALMQEYEKLAEAGKVRLFVKARANKLISDNGRITGVQFTNRDGKTQTEMGDAVILATGGYGAGGLTKGSLLDRVRPDLMHLPTTNGEHCRGDGIFMAEEVGAQSIGLQHVQVHPTGLVNLDDPDNRTKFLAAEALRGEGGILLDREGNRFCNDIGKRDYVTGCMWAHNKGPYRLVLNSKASSGIAWHCKHYCGRRVMKHFESGTELAKDMGISPEQLQASFQKYNEYAKAGTDPWDKKYFTATPFDISDSFYAATVTPVVHYAMGGLAISPKAECVNAATSRVIPGLYAAGELTGGVHGRNRLGGSALLECVVFGRVAGQAAVEYLKSGPPTGSGSGSSPITITVPQASGDPITITVGGNGVGSGPVEGELVEINPWDDAVTTEVGKLTAGADGAEGGGGGSSAAPADSGKEYTMEEVAKHKKENDAWVVVNGEVLDVTEFLPDHPGGKMAIMAFVGRDATEEFNMVHDEGVVQKYAPNTVIGKLKVSSKL
jgi:flavocytochrome c